MTGRPPSTGPKRDKPIKILVTPELLASVTAAARKEGRSVSDWGQRLFGREVAAARTASKPTARGRKRCPRCNQLLLLEHGALPLHNRPSSPFDPCSALGGKAR